MSKSDAFDSALLGLIYQAQPIAGLADNAAVGAIADIYVALHTADPGEAGNQSTHEAAYTGYARKAVARSAAGWSITDNVCSPVADIQFSRCTAGAPEEETYFSTGVALAGATMILHSGPIAPTITMAPGVIPMLDTATTITED